MRMDSQSTTRTGTEERYRGAHNNRGKMIVPLTPFLGFQPVGPPSSWSVVLSKVSTS